MSKYINLIFLLFLASCNFEKPDKVILKNANVINVINGEISVNSLLIENGIIKDIKSIQDIDTSGNPITLDCTGKYIIPGLIDMHTHILEHKNSTHLLDSLVKLGITTIRDMGGHADSIAQLKLNIEKGLILSPNIYFAGYTLDGFKERDEPDNTTWVISDTTDLNKIVSKQLEYNVDFIKVHSYYPNHKFQELLNSASKNNLKVVGHIPRHIDPITAIESGLASVEHANSLIESLVTAKNNEVGNITEAFYALDSTYLASLSKSFRDNNAAFTPTLHIINKTYQSNPDDNLKHLGKLMMDRFLQITLTLHQNGVLLLAGSDDVPVVETNLTALHQELEWLVKAGLPPLDAIQTATINSAKFLNIDADYGSIDVGKEADLIVLNSNPLDNISNVSDIANTMKSGKLVK